MGDLSASEPVDLGREITRRAVLRDDEVIEIRRTPSSEAWLPASAVRSGRTISTTVPSPPDQRRMGEIVEELARLGTDVGPRPAERAPLPRVGGGEGREMPKFQVTVADEAGHKLYDETIDAPGPMEACAKAVADARTADVAESEEPLDSSLVPPFTMDS